ncbi:extracellular solute-binding protein [Steroidobacter sp.]|uniref:extracellular solute-binding protein n=1 Tax=Steroidobacter sp. TaxID=1978227 RepID=UPI001A3FF98F|nr:extracellular solute-binding protein [Steroidobacter sp.]MBL8267094.1 ABC transporter substrate-binding protein [Steroidobacter sp.]
MRRQRAHSRLAGCLLTVATAFAPIGAHAAHAYTQFGDPKYPASFDHFDYVNPRAPQGGTLRLSTVSTNASFDKYNPFTLRGRAAPGTLELMFETLAVYSLDERNAQYGLLAEDITAAPDFSSATFRLRSQARFNNGDPVTAQDVQHSFDTLKSSAASPKFRSYFADIERVEVVDPRTARFHFKRQGRDLVFIAGSLPVFSKQWGRRSDGSTPAFDALGLDAPVSSGPYLIEASSRRQDIRFKKNPNYWAEGLNVRKGMFNFENIVFYLYSDVDARRAALRSGKYDFFNEVQMWPWRVMYFGKLFDSGEFLKEIVPNDNPPAMNGWVLNLRRDQFRDVRVRQALSYLFDYEWLNDRQFSGRFKRMDSYFARTPLAAQGEPSAAELALLEPYRNELPPAVFGPMVSQPTTHAPSSMRDSFTRAIELLAEAGWNIRDGVLRNAAGEPFVIEISINARKQSVLDSIYLNMRKAGIVVIRRLNDVATERRKLNSFDFDYIALSLRESRMPGEEIWRVFNSAAADVAGSENIAGVKSRAVDELTQRLMVASTQTEQETVGKALDRVLIHQHYVIPWRYLPDHYLIHHRRLRRPNTVPLYYAAQEWAIATWWDGDRDTPSDLLSHTTEPQR